MEEKIENMLINVIIVQREREKKEKQSPAGAGSGDDTDGDCVTGSSSGNKRTLPQPSRPASRPSKRQQLFQYKDVEQEMDESSHLLGSGCMASSDAEGSDEENDAPPTPYKQAKDIMAAYKYTAKQQVRGRTKSKALLAQYPRLETHLWWRYNAKEVSYVCPETGEFKKVDISPLGEVAKAVLALTGGSGPLERDFCAIPSLIDRKRAGMAPTTAEMNLIAYGLQRTHPITPDDVLELSREEAVEKKPPRMKDRRMIESLSKLDFDDGLMDDLETAVDTLSGVSSIAELVMAWEGEDWL